MIVQQCMLIVDNFLENNPIHLYTFFSYVVNSHKLLYCCIECIVGRLYNSVCLLLIIFMKKIQSNGQFTQVIVSLYWVYCWTIIQQYTLIVDNFHEKKSNTLVPFFSYVPHNRLYCCIECIVGWLYNSVCLLLIIFLRKIQYTYTHFFICGQFTQVVVSLYWVYCWTIIQQYTLIVDYFLEKNPIHLYTFFSYVFNSHKPLYRRIECIVGRLYNSVCLLLIIFMKKKCNILIHIFFIGGQFTQAVVPLYWLYC